jgi:hypothetical protein
LHVRLKGVVWGILSFEWAGSRNPSGGQRQHFGEKLADEIFVKKRDGHSLVAIIAGIDILSMGICNQMPDWYFSLVPVDDDRSAGLNHRFRNEPFITAIFLMEINIS